MLDERADGYVTFCALAKLHATEKCKHAAYSSIYYSTHAVCSMKCAHKDIDV